MSASGVYLDYAATTPVAAEVAARMAECLTREGTFGNPGSASHAYGEAASAAVEAARAQVAAAVGAQAADVVFTSGATEANNLAIFGTAQYYRDAGKAHRHGAHRAQVGARSVQGARAARLERHVSRARMPTEFSIRCAWRRPCAPIPCWCPSCT
jgi:selenocysteine lyase/cysteine desulfurase